MTKHKFKIGNTYGKGRPKKKSTIIKEFLKNHPMAYDEMMEVLYDLGKDKTDREAAQYICDRIKGRPHQSTTVLNETKLDPGRLLQEIKILRDAQLALESKSTPLSEETNV